ncbi:MAG: anaerobic magnesium-protoporphyrin monomethyl ester cyclase [Blastocatellia bacterium]|nr:anaerobic magnesium-protoporphyrin monomethyl ester cyclase [Blastocatellia bacterium]
MSIVVLADLSGKNGFVNKDTVAGGYGSRFRGDSVTTSIIQHARGIVQNVPGINVGYLAAIFAAAGHKVIHTRDDRVVDGDLGLVLTSLVDYRHECDWARSARARGMKVGFFGMPATHLPEVFDGVGDFIIVGEPEAAAIRIAAGEDPKGIVPSPAIENLNSVPFPRWDLLKVRRYGHANRTRIGLVRAVPMLTSRSCPEHCTYCPHRITANFRARSVENVVEEMKELCRLYPGIHLVIRDPLFTLNRDRCFRIAERIQSLGLRLSYECETRMDDLDEELIRAMHASGLREISFGVESPDPATLKAVARRFIPHDHMRSMIKLCWKLGIATIGFYVIGFLQDTEESIRDLVCFAINLDTTFANFKILTPYPGTPQFKQLKPLIFEKDWEKFDGYTLNFRHPTLTRDHARRLLRLAYTRFFFRPSQLCNYFGRHRYSQHPLFQRADRWAWRRQETNDSTWITPREFATHAETKAVSP